jgi:hypothetical protein
LADNEKVRPGMVELRRIGEHPASSRDSWGPSMATQQPTNHGEGNPEAAAEFNTAEQSFVSSERGKWAIEGGTHVPPDEEAELAWAERLGRERARGEDPDLAGRSKP